MSETDCTKLPSPGERRTELLNRALREIAERWARQFRDELLAQGRPLEGGWPGTLGQARACVDSFLLPRLVRARMPEPNGAERVELARALYSAARRQWLQVLRGG